MKAISSELFKLKVIASMQRLLLSDYYVTELSSIMTLLHNIDQGTETEFLSTRRERIVTKLEGNKVVDEFSYSSLYDVFHNYKKILDAVNLYET